MRQLTFCFSICAGFGLMTLTSGCGGTGTGAARAVGRGAAAFVNAVNRVQEDDQRALALPRGAVDRGDTIIINNDATVVTNVDEQLVVEELPNRTVLAFENQTGFDIFVRYAANGVAQSIFVLDRETVPIDYPCLSIVELLTEDDFDPITGDFVDTFDLSDAVFLRPDDFDCGDAFIITIDSAGVLARPEAISLIE